MPRINQYTDNTTIENDDKMLTYDTQGAATKLTAFSTIWNWIVSKLHALTSSSAALTPSTDRVLMDKNGTMTRVEPAAVAKYGIETYNGSTIAGSAQTVKSALDTLNSKTEWKLVGQVIGKSSLSLPSSYQELYIFLQYGTSSTLIALSFAFSIPYPLTDSEKTLTDGYYLNSNSNGFAQVYVSRTAAHITSLTVNGTDYGDTSKMVVYYR